jgi:hypothetical protein
MQRPRGFLTVGVGSVSRSLTGPPKCGGRVAGKPPPRIRYAGTADDAGGVAQASAVGSGAAPEDVRA